MTRRGAIAGVAAATGAVAAALGFSRGNGQAVADSGFPVSLSPTEWRRRLTPAQYYILRDHGTERPWTSPLNAEKRAGAFRCAGCEQALFKSETKYDSGTGWPSFWAPIDGAIGTARDVSFFMVRTEVHCSRCGGHLGHVFNDGPQPTGKRYCINGDALTFTPA